MTDLSPEARRLLHLARGEDDPCPTTRERVGRALATNVALGASVTVTGAAAAKAGSAAGLLTFISKPVVVAGLVAVTAAGSGALMVAANPAKTSNTASAPSAPRPASPTPFNAAATPKVTPAESTSAPSAPELAPHALPTAASTTRGDAPPRSPQRAAAVASSPPSPPRLAPTSTPDPLRAEVDGLRQAQRALREGDGEAALRYLDREEAQHRGGVLVEERAAARVLALCQSKSDAQARAEAESFAQRWPRSALLARVQNACRKP